jgi:hypothetical protein
MATRWGRIEAKQNPEEKIIACTGGTSGLFVGVTPERCVNMTACRASARLCERIFFAVAVRCKAESILARS